MVISIATNRSISPQNYFVHIFKKAVILEKLGMNGKSDMKMTFNVCNEIKEIQDLMSHYSEELKASWGYSDAMNLRGSAQ